MIILSRRLLFFTRITFISLIIIGLGIRSYKWFNYSFDFDQVQIVQNAANIIDGHLTLIGPRTSAAPMFTGPLIYYLTAFYYLFFPTPLSLPITSLTIAFITGTTLMFLGKRYFRSDIETTILLLLWAFSPLIVAIDRSVWNPNLSLIAASLVYFPLNSSKKLHNLDYILVGAGCFLGYQAHFSGLLLPILVLIFWFIRHRSVWQLPAAALFGLILSLLPTIVFDLRHQWFNLKGFLTLIDSQQTVMTDPILYRWLRNGYITLETLGKLLATSTGSKMMAVLGGIITFAYIVTFKKKLIPLWWCGLIITFFSFYRQVAPEYYFQIQYPALIFMLVSLAAKLQRTVPWTTWVLVPVFCCLSLITNYRYAAQIGKLTLLDQINTSRYLHEVSKKYPIAKIDYHMPHGQSLGLEFLTRHLPLDSTGKTITITFPTSGKVYPVMFGLIGVEN